MDAANHAFTLKIDRNQYLFCCMLQELFLTIDEKKTSNEALMENVRETSQAERKNRRESSVSMMNVHNKPSF